MIKIGVENNTVVVPYIGKKTFKSNIPIRPESIQRCIDFAGTMAFGEGFHQPNAFGGRNYTRNNEQIFRDALQGKIAEIGFYNYCLHKGIRPDHEPDFGIWGRGRWEDRDFTFNGGGHITSIKSTKQFGNLLLLEKARYNVQGEYLEPANPDDPPIAHDTIFLTRVSGVSSGRPEDYQNPNELQCEITGFITHNIFLTIISEDHSIPAGVKIGIPMIVDNYYCVASDLISPQEFNP